MNGVRPEPGLAAGQGLECLRLRVHRAATRPTVVYLPGLHGDWTLVGAFRAALAGRTTFVELTYPRTVTWRLADYAAAIDEALRAEGLEHGWLLAESFGSQVAWAMLAAAKHGWRTDGLILAGGFVRYRPRWLVRWGACALRGLPMSVLRGSLRGYVGVVRLMRRGTGWADLAEFVARRTEADKLAAAHRLELIAESDWEEVASAARLPVFHLTGLFDPVVWWRPVRQWLRRHCPMFRGSRVIVRSDHNVLGSAPRAAAEQVLRWIAAESGAS